jgi:hypothetical protein
LVMLLYTKTLSGDTKYKSLTGIFIFNTSFLHADPFAFSG